MLTFVFVLVSLQHFDFFLQEFIFLDCKKTGNRNRSIGRILPLQKLSVVACECHKRNRFFWGKKQIVFFLFTFPLVVVCAQEKNGKIQPCGGTFLS